MSISIEGPGENIFPAKQPRSIERIDRSARVNNNRKPRTEQNLSKSSSSPKSESNSEYSDEDATDAADIDTTDTINISDAARDALAAYEESRRGTDNKDY